jgi:DNA-directed RNA polymerase, mitochondrial
MIWQSLQEIVVAAFSGMAWFQKAARQVVKSGQPLTWTVPATGFPVRQEYFVMHKQQVRTMLAGRVIKPVLYSATKEVETYKQANAVAPNVVHSLDAAALMLTVSQAMNDGVEHFAVVHDSYGTVPGDMSVLAQATRQSFVKLYTSHDVIEELRVQFQAQAPEGVTIEAPPEKGTLEVSQVLSSAYFFC